MAKALEFNDIMTKVSNVFKKDIYIINGKYIIGGDESEAELSSTFICVLTEELSKIILEKFDNADCIYIVNTKKIKIEFDENYKIINQGVEKETTFGKYKSNITSINNIDEWTGFDFTSDTIEKLLSDNGKITLFEDNENIPSIIITKDLLPLVNAKNFDNVYYNQSSVSTKEDDIYRLILSIDTEWMQIYNIIYYLDVL